MEVCKVWLLIQIQIFIILVCMEKSLLQSFPYLFLCWILIKPQKLTNALQHLSEGLFTSHKLSREYSSKMFAIPMYPMSMYPHCHCLYLECFYGNMLQNWQRGQKSYIMYHGTTMLNAMRIINERFRRSSDVMLGPGVYVTRSLEKANHYPVHSNWQMLAVLRVSVRVGRVKRIDFQGHPQQKTWHFFGYDTAWVPPYSGMVYSGLEENCVYDPKRITVLYVIPNPRPW